MPKLTVNCNTKLDMFFDEDFEDAEVCAEDVFADADSKQGTMSLYIQTINGDGQDYYSVEASFDHDSDLLMFSIYQSFSTKEAFLFIEEYVKLKQKDYPNIRFDVDENVLD